MAHRRVPETIHDDGQTRIRYAGSLVRSDHLIISFSSIGQRRNMMPADEFTGTLLRAPDQHCMFVSDIGRSWMNDPALTKTIQRVVLGLIDRNAVTRVTTLGLSMGAFSALVSANLFPVTTAIAISPQFSVSDRVMPSETRWRFWSRRIRTFQYETAVAGNSPARAFIFHGLVDDADHIRAFGARPNVDHFVFPAASHSELGMIFKKAGILQELVLHASMHDRAKVARLIKKVGGMWRAKLLEDLPADLKDR